jgi:hypothetical protein
MQDPFNFNFNVLLETKKTYLNAEIKNYIDSQLKKNPKKEKKKDNRCFTCKPRGKVRKHIIGASMCSNFIFHHDMNHRPIIIMTPVTHITDILEFSPEQTFEMFKAISSFCNFWNIIDYQVSFNYGTWKTNEHFHVKIKINEKIIERMRGDHFRRIKLENNFK